MKGNVCVFVTTGVVDPVTHSWKFLSLVLPLTKSITQRVWDVQNPVRKFNIRRGHDRDQLFVVSRWVIREGVLKFLIPGSVCRVVFGEGLGFRV